MKKSILFTTYLSGKSKKENAEKKENGNDENAAQGCGHSQWPWERTQPRQTQILPSLLRLAYFLNLRFRGICRIILYTLLYVLDVDNFF
jgi:hypothetical protein